MVATPANSLNITSTGIQSFDGTSAFTGVTLTGTANQIAVTHGNGQGGNPTVALTSTIQVTGISFDAGTDTLQNYATGTFSPTIINSTTSPTVSYSVQVGRYTRVGNRVFNNINIVLTSYTAGTGDCQIGSLPFTSNATGGNSSQGSLGLQNVTFGASIIGYLSLIANSATVLQLIGLRSAASDLPITAAGPSNTAIFKATIVEEV